MISGIFRDANLLYFQWEIVMYYIFMVDNDVGPCMKSPSHRMTNPNSLVRYLIGSSFSHTSIIIFIWRFIYWGLMAVSACMHGFLCLHMPECMCWFICIDARLMADCMLWGSIGFYMILTINIPIDYSTQFKIFEHEMHE